jgi:hypothetical protein
MAWSIVDYDLVKKCMLPLVNGLPGMATSRVSRAIQILILKSMTLSIQFAAACRLITCSSDHGVPKLIQKRIGNNYVISSPCIGLLT